MKASLPLDFPVIALAYLERGRCWLMEYSIESTTPLWSSHHRIVCWKRIFKSIEFHDPEPSEASPEYGFPVKKATLSGLVKSEPPALSERAFKFYDCLAKIARIQEDRLAIGWILIKVEEVVEDPTTPLAAWEIEAIQADIDQSLSEYSPEDFSIL